MDLAHYGPNRCTDVMAGLFKSVKRLFPYHKSLGRDSMIYLIALALLASFVPSVSAQSIYGGTQRQSPGIYGNNGFGGGTGLALTRHLTLSRATRHRAVPMSSHTNGLQPNNTQMDNYGTRGNVNPYTGQLERECLIVENSMAGNIYGRPSSAT